MFSIETERVDRVVIVRLNRPEALNAINTSMTREMLATLTELDAEASVGCFIITGSEKAFAAGADIKELAEKSFPEICLEDYFACWERFTSLRTPKIAAVRGYALGGGCELAMMCDMIYASESAKFGQPEIKLGVIPGMGGSQRLTKLIGRAKAMDMILTGRMINAEEAERSGLVARVYSDSQLLPETIKAAKSIANYGRVAVQAAREVVNRAEEVSLHEGLLFERRTYHALFATYDRIVGMQAFLNKEEPKFNNSCN